MTCQFCGSDTDVINDRAYVGGRGYAAVTQCRNKKACSYRQDLYAVVDELLSLTPSRAPAAEAHLLTQHRRAIA